MLFDFAALPRLETERLVLREVCPEADSKAMFDLFADPEVARFTDTGPFHHVDEAIEVIDWITQIFSEKRGMRWVITEKPDDVLIGTCGFNVWHRWNHSAEIGYDLRRSHWGRGLVPEALGEVLAFGFARMALNRVEADVTVGNHSSIRVLAKLGFEEEGLLRQRGFWRGQYHDVRFFSLLRQDWRG